ncbi:hypothetical protein ASswx1_124 [Aeromonas phage Asswx_1]|uniref:Uncharacterized protein n=1 Tax=Aeromonas phage Asswx_1 TaxID=2419739 RepID=A0A411B838_9CAUD|nr:hypothetical protein ASswx1_124 [Aeromonas phage Asswx_1]QAX99172.1 hypothetical protein assk_393 [Aeromonas phage Assk]
MQYILTEEEYKELKAVQKRNVMDNKKQLQQLCTKIANTMPIFYWGKEEADIWGCIHNEEIDPDEWEDVTIPGKEVMHTSGYCDECPVQDICPTEYKRWSK